MNYVNDKFQRSFEIVAEKFLSKIRCGELIVTFPSGSTKSFKGSNSDEIADLKLHNYKFISKIFKRKSIDLGFPVSRHSISDIGIMPEEKKSLKKPLYVKLFPFCRMLCAIS